MTKYCLERIWRINFRKFPLSDFTVRHRIDELAEDIKLQVLEKIKSSPFFAICCDESTDEGNFAQLLVYARYVANDSAEEERLFSQALKTTATADDNFEAVSKFFDGAPEMIGSRSGFLTKVKGKLTCCLDALHHSPSCIGFQNVSRRSMKSLQPRYQGS
jgi:hypothetical protein